MTRTSTVAMAAGCVLLCLGCGKRIPEPSEGHSDAPHIGWVIMSGDAENPDRDFVCQSNPRNDCVVPIDRPGARALGHLHMYYHAAARETRYTGTVRIGFFDNPHDFHPDFVVKHNDRAATQSVSDFLVDRPGKYTLAVDVTAAPAGGGPPRRIREQVDVVAK